MWCRGKREEKIKADRRVEERRRGEEERRGEKAVCIKLIEKDLSELFDLPLQPLCCPLFLSQFFGTFLVSQITISHLPPPSLCYSFFL
jgi:hypothetical protein